MADPEIKVALFDIAGTLTSINIWKAMTNSPMVSESRLRRIYAVTLPFWALYKMRIYSELSFRNRWVRALARLIEGWRSPKIDELFEWSVNTYLVAYYRADVVAELQQLKATGVYIILISNMFEEFCEKVARRLGADKGLGTQLEFANGVATGRIVGRASAGHQKIENALAHLKTQGIEIDFRTHATAYADSISDLPLLASVQFPIAVYPDAQLAAEAQRRGWRILGIQKT